jgi:DNA-binding response OmpR family regulator
VLLVDDDEDTRQVVAALLTAEGYQASTVATAEAAFDALRQSPVDLVVVDYDLPGMNGLELCRRLLGERGSRGESVVMLSARTEERLVDAAYRTGAEDFIPKPFRVAELIARLTAALFRRRLRAGLDLT